MVRLALLLLCLDIFIGKLTIGRQVDIDSCFKSYTRTSGPVIKEVTYTGKEDCADLCLSYDTCKGVTISPISWSVTQGCYIVGEHTTFRDRSWQYANRTCFKGDTDSDQFNMVDKFNIIDENGADGGSSGLLLYNGGTVCDDWFDQNAADAVCSLLGYEASGSKWTSESRWDIQEGYSITLDNVECSSSSWSSCTFSESPDCTHREDVFLTCTSREDSDQTFNIIDETGADGGSSGLLLYKGGTVCDDNFDQNAADAVCSLLGYKASGSRWVSGYRWSEQYGYSITLVDVNCRNSSWSSCTYSESSPYCTHRLDVFLTCTSREVDGGWSDYGHWSQCSGSGCVRSRSRACNNPAPAGGGAYCQGLKTQSQYCSKYYCQVDGGWSDYGDWSQCSGSDCVQSRSRACNNPAPAGGGADCQGLKTQSQYCSKYYCQDSNQFNIIDENGSDGGSSGLLLYNGGTVCDDNFNQYAANAVCSLLGYNDSGPKWTSGLRWDFQEEYNSITLVDVTCYSNWSRCTYESGYHDSDCSHTEDIFLTCISQQEGILIGNNILYIILAAVPLCVGIFVGAFLYRKHKRNQMRSSREFQMVHTGENATIPSAPVPQTADNVQEGPGTEAAVLIPALGASNHAPPTYREAVNEYFEERVPTYEDVMADKNIYDIPI